MVRENVRNNEVPYWGLLKNLSDTAKLELIARLSDSIAHKTDAGDSAHWADCFCGLWRDSRSAEEIASDIRAGRTINRETKL